ncbi:hypothetical protein PG985_001534 [Apiospora marii]|uniref:uncharacterized protein n=1 Tax=Apiospora marii TaxID=335849 RepID=UPI003130E03B
MSLSSGPETSSTLLTDSLHAAMRPSFTPGQCLFCPNSFTNFSDSVTHMQKSHGLFVLYQESLIVDLETLFKYLHLVISEYRECIHCGTTRATVQAVQQHMTGKGHCRFDVSDDSEFAEFYDFSEPEEDEGDEAGEETQDEETRATTTSSSHTKPVQADEASLRLPSGKIISKQSSPGQTGPSSTQQFRRRTRKPLASQLEYSQAEPDAKEKGDGSDSDSQHSNSQARLSKREKRERAAVTHQLSSMSAGDRRTLIHLPAAQQRALLATQLRHQEKAQKEEKRRRARVDRKGNRNLYAYWHTETPVYTCG